MYRLCFLRPKNPTVAHATQKRPSIRHSSAYTFNSKRMTEDPAGTFCSRAGHILAKQPRFRSFTKWQLANPSLPPPPSILFSHLVGHALRLHRRPTNQTEKQPRRLPLPPSPLGLACLDAPAILSTTSNRDRCVKTPLPLAFLELTKRSPSSLFPGPAGGGGGLFCSSVRASHL